MLTLVSSANLDGAPDELATLRTLAGQVESGAASLRSLRAARDEEIRRIVRNGVSERRAAGAAGVSPGYAHRAAVHGRAASAVPS